MKSVCVRTNDSFGIQHSFRFDVTTSHILYDCNVGCFGMKFCFARCVNTGRLNLFLL